jgi:DNA modification methylase
MSEAYAPKVVFRHIEELKPYERNARTHSKEQVAQIAASMREFGWTFPLLITEAGGVIAGHGRIEGAKLIYGEGGRIRFIDGSEIPPGTVPTITAIGWSKAQIRAYIIADNKLAENAGWDNKLLSLELSDLRDLNFDLSLTGFNPDEIAAFLAPKTEAGLTDPDDVPETPSEPVTRKGDVWVLGQHRVMCGDSTSADDVAKLLGPVKPHLMITDPPYGVEYNAKRRSITSGDGSQRATGAVLNDDRADWREAWALFPGSVAYVWHGMLTANVVQASLEACEFKLRAQIVWRKARAAISPANMNLKGAGYSPQHECCFYMLKGDAHWSGGRSQTTIWEIDHTKSETGHSTQKPVECMRRPMENNSSPGQAVYEPFSGSGTTIIAGEMTGRAVLAMELNPAYVDVAVTRWAQFTGLTPVLEETGQTFVEVMAERNIATTPRATLAKPQSGKKKDG